MSGVARGTVWRNSRRRATRMLCALALTALGPPAVAADTASPDPCNASPQPAYCRPDFRVPGERPERPPAKRVSIGGEGRLITRAALVKAISEAGRNGTVVINGNFDFTESSDTTISSGVTIRAGRRVTGPRVPCGWRISNSRGTVRMAGLRFIASPGTKTCITVVQGALALAGTRFDASGDPPTTIDDTTVYIDVTGGELTIGPKATPTDRPSSDDQSDTADEDNRGRSASGASSADFALPVEMYGPSVLDGRAQTVDPRGIGIRVGRDATATIENLKVSGMRVGVELAGSGTVTSTTAQPVTLCDNTTGTLVSATRSGGGLFDQQAALRISGVSFSGNQTAVEIGPTFAGSVTLADPSIRGVSDRDCHKGWYSPSHTRPSRGLVVGSYSYSGEVSVLGGSVTDTDTALALMGAIDLNARAPAGPVPKTVIMRNRVGVSLEQVPSGGGVNRLRGLSFASNFGHDLWVGPSAGGSLELSVSDWSSDDARRTVGFKGKPRFSTCIGSDLDDGRLKNLKKLCPKAS